jgi:flavin-dependent dehydrogenase
MIEHEVCIIGGSLAGAACARELERLGIDAVAFERDLFPREKVCGCFVSPGGVACLEHFGVVGALRDAGAAPIYSARLRVGKAETEVRFGLSGGLGVSRSLLDNVMSASPGILQGHAVRQVLRRNGGFVLTGESFEVSCRILIDASGKLSRFTQRRTAPEFGVQYVEPEARRSVLDFWFFENGYGGGVSVEGGVSNYCFLVRREALPEYLKTRRCLVTGPLAYNRVSSDYIAIGDAAGMVDPFCGEGIRHALDTGMTAARVVARGIRNSRTYEETRWEYDCERARRWSRRRALGAAFRSVSGLARQWNGVNRTLLDLMSRLWLRYAE